MGMSRRKSGSGYSLNLLFRFSSQKDIAAIPHAASGFMIELFFNHESYSDKEKYFVRIKK
jgi:hypothetical protein